MGKTGGAGGVSGSSDGGRDKARTYHVECDRMVTTTMISLDRVCYTTTV